MGSFPRPASYRPHLLLQLSWGAVDEASPWSSNWLLSSSPQGTVWFSTPPVFFLRLLPSRPCPAHSAFTLPLRSLCARPSCSQAVKRARQPDSGPPPPTPLGPRLLGPLRASGVQAARDHQAQWLSYFFSCRNPVHRKSYPKSQGWAKSLLKVRGVERLPPFAAAALRNPGQFENQQRKSIVYMGKLRGEHGILHPTSQG